MRLSQTCSFSQLVLCSLSGKVMQLPNLGGLLDLPAIAGTHEGGMPALQ